MYGLIRELKNSFKAESIGRIYLPDEIEFEQEERSKANRVVLVPSVLDTFNEVAQDAGL